MTVSIKSPDRFTQPGLCYTQQCWIFKGWYLGSVSSLIALDI